MITTQVGDDSYRDNGSDDGSDNNNSGADNPGEAPEGFDAPCVDCAQGLIPSLPTQGSVPVTLVPNVVTTGSTLVAFGAPFPPDTLMDVSQLVVADAAGVEIPSHVVETARWRSLSGAATPNSVRAALVYVDVAFNGTSPLDLTLRYGDTRSLELGAQAAPETTWVAVTDGEYTEAIREPVAYASFEPEWLGGCLFRSRTTTTGSDASLTWWDDALIGFAHTAVNDVDNRVTKSNQVDYEGGNEPWLFDRAMTLFGVYFRTGDVKWLRHAHRAAQFYANHVTGTGYFDLKGEDLKYSYGQSMFVDLMLTGDTRMLSKIEAVADFTSTWNPTYRTSMNFWTERHQAYALLGALSAWEATGDANHAVRINEIVQASFANANNGDGCMLHQLIDHEGGGSDAMVCSPWMSALFADAMWRYYLHSQDAGALNFLANLGDFIKDHGTYTAELDRTTYLVPWYLSSSAHKHTDSGEWADIEHTCDVAGLTAKAAWARQALGGDSSALEATTAELMKGCQFSLDYWHREGGPEAGKAVWRLTPSRKFNWWFGTSIDLPWLMTAMK